MAVRTRVSKSSKHKIAARITNAQTPKRHRRTKVEMEEAREQQTLDPMFTGCKCFVMFNGWWDNQLCGQHKTMVNFDPTVGHEAECQCNQCLDNDRLLIRMERGLV